MQEDAGCRHPREPGRATVDAKVKHGEHRAIMGCVKQVSSRTFPGLELDPYTLVDTESAWTACLNRMRREPRLAVDLEANSLYAYRERVCLLQFSIPGADYIVDPLAGFALDGLGDILADPRIEKVFHASEYDLILLRREYDWSVVNLFDTMWAARVLGHKNMGLAGFLRDLYGIELSKKHQKANWAKRPLTEEQLQYAQMDTAYLFDLRDHLAGELEAHGLMAEAREIFMNACRVTVPDRTFDPDSFWSVRGARDLNPVEQGVLRALFVWRDGEAARRDWPPFKVINNDALVELAKAMPETAAAVANVPKVAHRVAARLGAKIVAAVKRGKSVPPPKRRRRKDPTDPAVLDRYERLLQWRKQSARKRDVESDVIISRDAMWDIAHLNPTNLESLASIETLGPHRLELHGESIISELHGPRPVDGDRRD